VDVRKVGVVGLGTMGAGITQVCVQAGFETVGREVTEELCERARQTIEHYLARGVEKGRLTGDERDAALGRLTATTDLADLAACDLVIEAIVEELEPKQALFAELSALLPDGVLATNTSALSVTEIAGGAARPERVVGLHFFNPAPVLPLVEVVRTELVDESVYEAAYAFAAALGKEPIHCHDTPGFVVNRILIPLLLRARARRGTRDARGSGQGDALRPELADRTVRPDRPDRNRRPRARLRGALAVAARAPDGCSAAARRDGGGGPARAEVRPRLLRLRRVEGLSRPRRTLGP